MRKGGAFRLVGLILGVVSFVISITAIVFSIVGFVMGRKRVMPVIRR